MPNRIMAAIRGRKARAAAIKPQLAATDLGNGEAEIVMYGDVTENEPVNWWTGEPTGELTISAQRFIDELQAIRNASHISVRLNSGGGDVFTGVAIHNALKELPGTKTIHIEGLAASAASIIACAGDEVVVHPGSMFMIHKGYVGMYGWYTPDELALTQNQAEAIVKSMTNIYTAKTGRSEDEIGELVAAETWFVGQEIVDAGFADTLAEPEDDDDTDQGEVDDVVYDASARTLTVRGIRHDASMFRNVPTAAVHAAQAGLHAAGETPAAAAIDKAAPPMAAKTKGETHMETVAELRASHPELVAQIEAQAAENERERIKAIDEIAGSVAPDMVAKAKFEEPITAGELAVASIKAGKDNASKFLAAIEEDDDESKADDVDSDPNGGGEGKDDEDKEAEAAIKAAAEVANSLAGRKAR